jgi:hypothetical protein
VTAVRAVFFPLDEQLGLIERWSQGLVKQVLWLSGLVVFERAEEILSQVGQIAISDSSIWRRAQEGGERFREVLEAEQEKANRVDKQPEGISRKQGVAKGRMGSAMDGTMIHIREEGWKELKVGCVFKVESRRKRDEERGEVEQQAHAVESSYVAHLGGPEIFGQKMWAEADRRYWEQASATEVLGDGAHWIWNLAEEHFYDSHQLVDWYHGTEHLAVAAGLIKGEETPAAAEWFEDQKETLFRGRALRVARTLESQAQQCPAEAKDLRRETGYFQNNWRRMNYQDMREGGWVIGSGMVESGAKQFKARMAGPGMRWSRSGAENLIPVRKAILSDRFDDLWQQAYNSPPS